MPLPEHAARFEEGWAEGKLLLQRCLVCQHVPSFPRVVCPRCFSALEWFEAAGTGRIVTFTVLRRTHNESFEPYLPIVLAVIELEEGSELIATLVGADRLECAIGHAVTIAPEERWSALPQFRLAG